MRTPRLSLLAVPAIALLAGCQNPEPGPSVATTTPSSTVAPMTGATSGSSAAVAGARRISGSELRSELADNTVSGVARNGQTFYSWFSPNGALHFQQADVRDTGSWSVNSEGQLCTSLTHINAGGQSCFAVYRNGNSLTFERTDGEPVGTFTFVPGNPQNL